MTDKPPYIKLPCDILPFARVVNNISGVNPRDINLLFVLLPLYVPYTIYGILLFGYIKSFSVSIFIILFEKYTSLLFIIILPLGNQFITHNADK